MIIYILAYPDKCFQFKDNDIVSRQAVYYNTNMQKISSHISNSSYFTTSH